MEFAELEKLIKTRRSIRKWKTDAVPEELLLKAIELAGWSPNSGGKQPYHCYVITNPAINCRNRRGGSGSDRLSGVFVQIGGRPGSGGTLAGQLRLFP